MTRFCQYSDKTFWIFPKFAIVVRMGTKPFNVETASTMIVSENFTMSKKIKISTKLRIRFVCNDLAAAAISDATASLSFVPDMKSSLTMGVSPVEELHLF
jgi:hypothetical protein